MDREEIKTRLTSFLNSYGFGGETTVGADAPFLISGTILCPETRLTLTFVPGTLAQIEGQTEGFAKLVEETSRQAAEEQRELEIEAGKKTGTDKTEDPPSQSH
jgi:hypothetical protein